MIEGWIIYNTCYHRKAAIVKMDWGGGGEGSNINHMSVLMCPTMEQVGSQDHYAPCSMPAVVVIPHFTLHACTNTIARYTMHFVYVISVTNFFFYNSLLVRLICIILLSHIR